MKVVDQVKSTLSSDKLILLITATEIEADALLQKLSPLNGQDSILNVHYNNHTYNVAKLSQYNVVHVQCASMGMIKRDASITTTMEAIDDWNPDAVIMLGIAFGKDERTQKIGDVLVSKSIIDYDSQRISKDSITLRNNDVESGKLLYSRFSAAKYWRHSLTKSTTAKIICGAILSGSKLIDNPDYKSDLLTLYPSAVGGEMEGYGIYSSCTSKNIYEWIIVKGICDWADGNKNSGKVAKQKRAAESAVSLCYTVFSQPDIFQDLPINTKRIRASSSFDNYLTISPPRVGTEFMHRDSFVHELINKLEKVNHRIMLMNGLGGVGKTSIARTIYHSLKKNFRYVAWLEYNNDLDSSFLKSLNIFLDIPDPKQRLEKIKLWMQSQSDMLFIIDNITKTEQEDDCLRWLSSLDCHIIVTSRLSLINDFEPFRVGLLEPEECIDVFYAYYKKDKHRSDIRTVEQLIALVSYHTLGIELLAKAANRPNMDLDTFYNSLVSIGFGFPDLKIHTDHTKAMLTIAKHIKKLFRLMHLPIKSKLLLKNIATLPSVELVFDIEKWLQADINDLMELSNLGWLTVSECGYYMHPIIKQSILLQSKVKLPEIRGLISHLIEETRREPSKSFVSYLTYSEYAQSILSLIIDDDTLIAHLANNVGLLFIYQGDIEKALYYYNIALEIRKKILASDDVDLANTYSGVAEIQRRMKNLDEAIACNKIDIDISEKKLQDMVLSVGASYNNLALVYLDKEDYVSAKELSEKAIKCYEFIELGDHPYFALIYHNYAQSLCGSADFKMALKAHEEEIRINNSLLQADNPDLAMSYTNLSKTYYKMKRFTDAKHAVDRAINIFANLHDVSKVDLVATYQIAYEISTSLSNFAEAKKYKEILQRL